MPKGTINGERYQVPEGYCCVSDAQARRGAEALNLLQDLDRSPNGRHEGDAESQSPTGLSQGNDRIRPGDCIGYTMSGERIVVPPRPTPGDPGAWIARRAA